MILRIRICVLPGVFAVDGVGIGVGLCVLRGTGLLVVLHAISVGMLFGLFPFPIHRVIVCTGCIDYTCPTRDRQIPSISTVFSFINVIFFFELSVTAVVSD